jgi:hypothetical protein
MSEPQSIVHQVIRLQRKVAGSITKRRGAGAARRERKSAKPLDGDSCDSPMKAHTCHSYASSYLSNGTSVGENMSSVGEDESFCTGSLASKDLHAGDDPTEEETPLPDELCNLTVSVPKPRYGNYRTINQNEFFIECMINGEGSNIIHFFDENSEESQELDLLLEKMAKKFPTCKFLRIDSALTQFVSSKLMITKFPALVAIRNKVVLDRLMDFEGKESVTEEYVKTWLLKTIPFLDEN